VLAAVRHIAVIVVKTVNIAPIVSAKNAPKAKESINGILK
jgi:hypothetical protein